MKHHGYGIQNKGTEAGTLKLGSDPKQKHIKAQDKTTKAANKSYSTRQTTIETATTMNRTTKKPITRDL